MKMIILLVAVCGALADPIDFFTTADDHLDMVAVLNDPVKLKAMTDCFLNKGPCEPIALSYKAVIPESMAHACQRCNEAQKHLANVYVNGIRTKTPEDYESFSKIYDPQGLYMDKFLEVVKGY